MRGCKRRRDPSPKPCGHKNKRTVVSALLAFLLLACSGPRAPVARPRVSMRRVPSFPLYCPEILANARHPGPASPTTPTPGAPAPPTPTPTPRLLLSRTVSAGIPPGDMIMIIEAVRDGRKLEPGGDVADDLLVNIAGNAMYGAQLQRIIEIQGYRVLECANAIVVQTPLGEIWILKGHVWARHPLPWLTPTVIR